MKKFLRALPFLALSACQEIGIDDGIVPGAKATLFLSENLAGPSCESRIGDLKLIRVDKEKNILSADFGFDPGLCKSSFKGRRLSLFFEKEGRISFRIFQNRFRADLGAGRHQWLERAILGEFTRVN